MGNSLLNGLKDATNYGLTENGAVKHLTTKSDILDMFALCGAYRNRSEDDCINMFKNALTEDETLAMKCLFYLADCRGGQGERAAEYRAVPENGSVRRVHHVFDILARSLQPVRGQSLRAGRDIRAAERDMLHRGDMVRQEVSAVVSVTVFVYKTTVFAEIR